MSLLTRERRAFDPTRARYHINQPRDIQSDAPVHNGLTPLGKPVFQEMNGGSAEVLFGIHGDQRIRIILIVSILDTINGIVLVKARLTPVVTKTR